MSLFKYSFFFKLHYETTFGYVVCITGNIKALGSWDPLKALRLDWSEVIKNFKFSSLKYFLKNYLYCSFINGPKNSCSIMTEKKQLNINTYCAV